MIEESPPCGSPRGDGFHLQLALQTVPRRWECLPGRELEETGSIFMIYVKMTYYIKKKSIIIFQMSCKDDWLWEPWQHKRPEMSICGVSGFSFTNLTVKWKISRRIYNRKRQKEKITDHRSLWNLLKSLLFANTPSFRAAFARTTSSAALFDSRENDIVEMLNKR